MSDSIDCKVGVIVESRLRVVSGSPLGEYSGLEEISYGTMRVYSTPETRRLDIEMGFNGTGFRRDSDKFNKLFKDIGEIGTDHAGVRYVMEMLGMIAATNGAFKAVSKDDLLHYFSAEAHHLSQTDLDLALKHNLPNGNQMLIEGSHGNDRIVVPQYLR